MTVQMLDNTVDEPLRALIPADGSYCSTLDKPCFILLLSRVKDGSVQAYHNRAVGFLECYWQRHISSHRAQFRQRHAWFSMYIHSPETLLQLHS